VVPEKGQAIHEGVISLPQPVHSITFSRLITTRDCPQKESLRGLRHQTSDMGRSDLRSWKLSIPILVVISFYFASAAYRHTIVLYTTPGRRETVRGPDLPIKIRFNSRIDSKRSRLTLLAPDGNQTALGIVETSSGDSLISEAKGLKSGVYLLRCQVLALDGHIIRGEVPFRVQQP